MDFKTLYRVNRYRAIVVLEILRGLDFSKQMDNAQIDVNKSDGNYFSSSAYFNELKHVLKDLKITSHDSILDFGAGKGATLALFNKYPFKKVGGVELSERLVHIAHQNLKKLKVKNYQLVHSDARLFTEIDDYNYFYFYNPFPAEIMAVVISNIISSINRNDREVYLVYCNPACHETIMESGHFTLQHIYDSETSWAIINLYKSKKV